MQVKPHDLIGGFELTKPIAEGSTGSVWLGRAVDTDVPVSIKLLRPEILPPSARSAAFETLRDCSTRLGKLTHQGLALVLGPVSDPERGVYGLVSELLEGPTLDEVPLARPPRGRPLEAKTIASVLGWFQQLAAALAWLHANGHAHGDLKAKNVVLLYGRERPHPKITDLCWSHAGLPRLAPHDFVLAPEQTLDGLPSTAGDQWCAAKLLRDVLTGSTSREAADQALIGSPLKLRQILERGLAADPSQRFRDMGGFFYAIENLKNELDEETRREGRASEEPAMNDSAAPTTMMEPVVRVRSTDPTQAMPAVRAPRAASPRSLDELATVDVPNEPFSGEGPASGEYIDLLPRRPGAPEEDTGSSEDSGTVALAPPRRFTPALLAAAAAAVVVMLVLAMGALSWLLGEDEIAAAPTAPSSSEAPGRAEESPQRGR